ncbi:DUF5711 family protein [Natronincola ferrireducens]|uniref:DUF5711 family protein n=1 Tax=Natronincola ferrireducens TaxID=393762 RepID=UPI000B80C3D0|nr:DUF5711 family protein [Natronincola ferrireducens]
MKNKRRIMFIFIATILIFLSFSIIKNIKTTMTTVEKEIQILEEIETHQGGNVVYRKFQNGVLQYWDGILYFYDFKGEKKWHLHLGIPSAEVKVSDESIYLADNGKKQLLRINKKGEIVYRYTTKETISSFAVCESNYVLVQYPLINSMTELVLLNEEGRKHSSIIVGEGMVMNSTLSKAHNLVAVNTLITNNALTSHLILYDMQGELIASNHLNDQLVLDFDYDTKGNLIIIKEEKITSINKGNKELWSVEVDKVKLSKTFSPQYTVIYGGEAGGNPLIDKKDGKRTKIIQYNGRVIGDAQTKEVIKGIDNSKEDIVVYSPRTIYVLDKRGEIKMEHKYSSDIEEIFLFSREHMAIITKGKLSFVRFYEG